MRTASLATVSLTMVICLSSSVRKLGDPAR
jgi:hypothetical protein